jgi:hypothetical protein
VGRKNCEFDSGATELVKLSPGVYRKVSSLHRCSLFVRLRVLAGENVKREE